MARQHRTLCLLAPAMGGTMMRMIFLAMTALALDGCATLDSVQPGAGGTTFQVTGRTYDQVWDAAIESVGAQLTIVQTNRATGMIKAEKQASLTSWGEVVGVFIHPAGREAASYSVEVESFKRSRAQITGENWTQTVVDEMKARLAQ